MRFSFASVSFVTVVPSTGMTTVFSVTAVVSETLTGVTEVPVVSSVTGLSVAVMLVITGVKLPSSLLSGRLAVMSNRTAAAYPAQIKNILFLFFPPVFFSGSASAMYFSDMPPKLFRITSLCFVLSLIFLLLSE